MQGPALALALAAALLTAGAACAWEPEPRVDQLLARGGRFVDVRADGTGASGQIRAAVDIAAPPQVVWRVLTDCALAPRMAARLQSCRILERDPLGRWDVREQVSRRSLLPSVRSVFRSDYDPPRAIAFHRLSGDLARFEGGWRLTTLDGGRRTRVLYESRVALPFRMPGVWARITLRRDVARALTALRRESLARADEGSQPAP